MLCSLCQTNPTGENSHIVPAFVFRWLKESSPTGYLRGTESPNKRKQDGIKHELLCTKCEDVFSKWETMFSNQVFRRLHQEGNTSIAFEYEDWLAKFCVSVSWRALTHLTITEGTDELPFGHGPTAAIALEHWRKFLLGEVADLGPYRQHLLITDAPTSSHPIKNDFDLALYSKRAVDLNTIHAPDECYIVTKMCDIVICGVILDSKPEQWVRTVVNTDKGRYKPGDFQVSGRLFKFFETAVDAIRVGRQKLSANQGDRILETFFKRFPAAKIEWEKKRQK